MPDMKLSSITVFFPCYNDAGTIPTMILRALQTLPQLTDDYEVVVINDGSQDDSALVLDEMARLYPDHVRDHSSRAAQRLWRRAARRLCGSAQRLGLLHRRRRAI